MQKPVSYTHLDVYKRQQEGVCKITDRITMDAREYYVLSPLSDHKLKLYIPILSSKKIGVRVLASEAELRSLYQEAEQADTPWIADRNARFRLYDESVQNGDLLEILKLSKILHARRKEKDVYKRQPLRPSILRPPTTWFPGPTPTAST